MNLRHACAIFCVLGLMTQTSTMLAQEPDGSTGDRTIGHSHPHLSTDGQRFTTSRDGHTLFLPGEDEAFSFVVFGDRTGGPAEGVTVLAQAVTDTNLIEPDLVMTVGDLVQGYNDTPQWLVQMKEYKGIMDGLLMPWFPVAGNHDVYWRGAGPKPDGENEALYETNFGPLWYAFEHKNSWFIVLYSDEGHPETGDKGFSQPDRQRISDEQFDWLKRTLAKAEGADHVFLFLHHPRWLGGVYGNDWGRVHKALVKAGNVSAVFAGHIHKMRYDGRVEGIEYITLATVGGSQSGVAPSAGYLHEFHLVTVRQSQIAVCSIPVGQVMDVRRLTGEVSNAAARLASLRPVIESSVVLDANGSAGADAVAWVTNPTASPIEITLSPVSDDSRWYFSPDHDHTLIEPGQRVEFTFGAYRTGHVLDDTYRPPQLDLDIDLLANDLRYPIPQSTTEIPIRVQLAPPPIPTTEVAADFDGSRAFIAVDNGLIDLPDGPMTLECWFNGDNFSGRRGLVGKTETSEYGFFVTDGRPSFYIFLSGAYTGVVADKPVLQTGQWHHIAGVFDGRQTRLYLDGQLVKSRDRSGVRRKNALPLMIGADVNGVGGPVSYFDGRIDGVRLSRTARYAGDNFTPARRPAADDDTLLLLNMDGRIGPWLYDESPGAVHPIPNGSVRLVGPD